MQKINLFNDSKIIKSWEKSSPEYSGKKQESGIKWQSFTINDRAKPSKVILP
jgi:hypothetical protein